LWPEPAATSSIRPLDARVAHREHHPGHVLFTRPCKRCGKPFDYCGSCQPGRLYHGEECSKPAREESKGKARAKYSDRESEEGRETHRLEEAARRDRLAKRRALVQGPGPEPVGDHRLPAHTGRLQVPALAARQAAAEARDDAPIAPVDRPRLGVSGLASGAEPRAGGAAHSPATEWTLVASPELLGAARRRLGTRASCPFCGRHGRVVRVLSLDEWRRRIRYGFR